MATIAADGGGQQLPASPHKAAGPLPRYTESASNGKHSMRAAAFLFAFAMLTACPVSADVWKWTDSEGHVHYGDTPPSDVKASKVGDAGVSVVPSAPEDGPRPTPQRSDQVTPAASKSERGANTTEADAKRKRMIERCEKDRGVDCEEAVDGMIDGTPVTVPGAGDYPVWIAPPPHVVHKPHPPTKPKPKPQPDPEPYLEMAPFPKAVKPK